MAAPKDPGFDIASASPVADEPGFDMASADAADPYPVDKPYVEPTGWQNFARQMKEHPYSNPLSPLSSPWGGMGEAALHFGTGTAANLLKSLRSAWELATTPGGTSPTAHPKIAAANAGMRSLDSMVYQPRGQWGQALGSAMDLGSSWPGAAATAAGNKVTDLTGSPWAGAGTSLALQAIPVVLGARYLGGQRPPALMSTEDAALAARANARNSLDLDFDSLSRGVQDKLTALARRGHNFDDLDPAAVARQSRLDELHIPYTRGDVTRDAAQVAREENISKAENAGRGVREIRAAQDAALHDSLDVLREGTGAAATTREGLGRSVQDAALRAKEAASKENYGNLYKVARETQPDATASPQPMMDLLARNPEMQHLGFMKSWLTKAKVLGTDEEGNITSLRDLNLSELDDLRKKAVGIARGGGTDGFYAGEAIKAIDQTMEGVPDAATAWKAARDAFKAHKMEFEDTGAVQKQVGMKSRVDRQTALADTFDRFIGGSADDIRNIRKSLTTGGNEKTLAAGNQAWKDLQGATIDYLRQKAIGKREIESDSSTEAGKTAFEEGRPLKQFNSTFRDAYSELKKDGKIDEIFSPEQVAQLDKIYDAVGDVRTRPTSRISGSPTAANAMAMLEDFSRHHGLARAVEMVPYVGKWGAAAVRGMQKAAEEQKQAREAVGTPLNDRVQQMTKDEARRRIWGRIMGMSAPTAVEGTGPQAPPGYARGGVVGYAEGGKIPAAKEALERLVKRMGESDEQLASRRALEQEQAGAPLEGMFSTADQLIQSAPESVRTPEQWQNWLAPGRALDRYGYKFPLKKQELEFTGLPKLFDRLKELSSIPTVEPTPKAEVPLTKEQKQVKDYRDWATEVAQRHGMEFDPSMSPEAFYRTNEQLWRPFHSDTRTPEQEADWNALNEHYGRMGTERIWNKLTGEEPEAEAKPADPFSAEALAKQGFTNPKNVPRNVMLDWLRANRPSVKSEEAAQYSGSIGDWMERQGPQNYVEDLSKIGRHWDPNVQPAINTNTAHFSNSKSPVSWGRSAQFTNPAGQTGRVLQEIQSDVHGRAADRYATPPPQLTEWAQTGIPDYVPQSVRTAIMRARVMRERPLEAGAEVPEGMGVRRVGYGPLGYSNPLHSTQPIYEGVPFQGMEGYPNLELRKLLARSVNEGSNFLGIANAADQGHREGSGRYAAMSKVYGTGDEPGIYGSALKRIVSPYGLSLDPNFQVGKDLPERGGTNEPIDPVTDRAYDPDQVRARMGRRAMQTVAPVDLGDYFKQRLQDLQTNINSTWTGAADATDHAKLQGSEPARDFRTEFKELVGNMAADVSRANDYNLMPWNDYNEASKARTGIRKQLDKMSDVYGGPTQSYPHLPTIKKHLERLEQLHDRARQLIEQHNARLAGAEGTGADAPPIVRQAVPLSPEEREIIKRVGVPMFTSAGAGLGLNAMQNPEQNPDQQDQGFARGGLARFGEGGKVVKQALKRLSDEQLLERQQLEQKQGKTPVPGMFSVLDKTIENAPFENAPPEQWQNYLKPGQRVYGRAGVRFPLKQAELEDTRLPTLFSRLAALKGQEPAEPAPPRPLTKEEEYKAWKDDLVKNKGFADSELGPYEFYKANRTKFNTAYSANPNDPLYAELDRHYRNANAGDWGPDSGAPVDPFSPESLAAHGLNPQSISKEKLLAYLRTTRPDIQGISGSQHFAQYMPKFTNASRGAPPPGYREDATVVRNPIDPNVFKQITENTSSAHKFAGNQRPMSWSLNFQVTDPETGEPGRHLGETQSDFHSKAAEKLIRGSQANIDAAQRAANDPLLMQRVRDEADRSLGALSQEREMQDHELEVPEGFASRPRGYGPLSEVESPSSGRLAPMYEGAPFQTTKGYAGLELRKQLALMAAQNEKFLSLPHGMDMVRVYGGQGPNAADSFGIKKSRGMVHVYGDPVGRRTIPPDWDQSTIADLTAMGVAKGSPEWNAALRAARPADWERDVPPAPGIIPSLAQEIGKPYGMTFSRDRPIAPDTANAPRKEPLLDLPDIPNPGPPFPPEQLAHLNVRGRAANVGDLAMWRLKQLNDSLKNNRGLLATQLGREPTLWEQLNRLDSAPRTQELHDTMRAAQSHFMETIATAANENALPSDDYEAALSAANRLSRARRKLGSPDWRASEAKVPGPISLRRDLNTLEETHQRAIEALTTKREAVAQENAAREARNAALGPTPSIRRPAISGTDDVIDKIRQAGVGLYTPPLVGAGLGAAAAASQQDQDQQGFASGGLAMAAGGTPEVWPILPDAHFTSKIGRAGDLIGSQLESGYSTMDTEGNTNFLGRPDDTWNDPMLHRIALDNPKLYPEMAAKDHMWSTDLGRPMDATNLGVVEGALATPAMGYLGAQWVQRHMPWAGGTAQDPTTSKLAKLMGKSARHGELYGDITDAVRRGRNIKEPNGLFERVMDTVGSAMSQPLIPGAAAATAAERLAPVAGRSLARSLLKAPLKVPKHVVNFLSPWQRPGDLAPSIVGGVALNEGLRGLSNLNAPPRIPERVGYASGGPVEDTAQTAGTFLGAPIPAVAKLLTMAARMHIDADTLHKNVISGMRKPS